MACIGANNGKELWRSERERRTHDRILKFAQKALLDNVTTLLGLVIRAFGVKSWKWQAEAIRCMGRSNERILQVVKSGRLERGSAG